MKAKIFKPITIVLLCLCAALGTLLLLAASPHYSERLIVGSLWMILLGVLLPLALLFLGLWLSHSQERGYPRHWRLLSLLAAVWMVLSLVLGLVLVLPDDPAFYARSDVGPYDSNAIVVDVSAPRRTVELGEDRTVTFAVGIGSTQNNNIQKETDRAHLTVSAEGCIVGGQKNEALWQYEEFTTDPLYLATVKDYHGTYDQLYPNCHETISVTFPAEDTSGTITFELVEYFGETSGEKYEYTDQAQVVLYYTIENDRLTLSIKEGTD